MVWSMTLSWMSCCSAAKTRRAPKGEFIDVEGVVVAWHHQCGLAQTGYGARDTQAAVAGAAAEIPAKVQQVVVRRGKLRQVNVIPVRVQVADDGQSNRVSAGRP
jgi:hypothetical protein